ncbi:hypothetical protein BH18ACI5_BH18ACI5_24240 [soil metagenome]
MQGSINLMLSLEPATLGSDGLSRDFGVDTIMSREQ